MFFSELLTSKKQKKIRLKTYFCTLKKAVRWKSFFYPLIISLVHGALRNMLSNSA